MQNIEICASMNESVDGVVATATFPQSLSTGVLMIQGPLQAEVSIPLSEKLKSSLTMPSDKDFLSDIYTLRS